jgi:hypothetical protein
LAYKQVELGGVFLDVAKAVYLEFCEGDVAPGEAADVVGLFA